MALVIGNAAYLNVAPLRNPVNDAMALATTLQQLGFQEVALLTNARRDGMLKAIAALGTKLKHGGVGLFFFAGHGIQVKGENYLVPVDAPLDSDTLEDNMVPVQRVLEAIRKYRLTKNIDLLDS